MNGLKIVKGVTGIVASVSTGVVVNNIVKFTTPEEMKTAEKVGVYIGGMVISGMVGKAASDYVENAIQETADEFKKNRHRVEDISTED